MPHISVINYQKKFIIPESRVMKAVASVAHALKLKHEAVNIVFVGKARMRSINKKFLRHDFVTDVITFQHGDIVICPFVAKRFSKIYGQDVNDEIVLYVIHGLLHLAGYKDKAPKDVLQMRAMEKKMLVML